MEMEPSIHRTILEGGSVTMSKSSKNNYFFLAKFWDDSQHVKEKILSNPKNLMYENGTISTRYPTTSVFSFLFHEEISLLIVILFFRYNHMIPKLLTDLKRLQREWV